VRTEEAEQAGQTEGAPPEHQAGPLSAGRAFLVVAILGVVAGLILILSAGNDTPAPELNPSPEPEQVLSEAEAVARARELSQASWDAIGDRDLDALSSIYTSDGPAMTRIRSNIERLLKDDVIDRATRDQVELEFVSSTEHEVRVRESRRLFSCFVTEEGEDVTSGDGVIEQVGLMILHKQGSEWLIHDARLLDDRVVEREHKNCA
jgi:hypothetical protein